MKRVLVIDVGGTNIKLLASGQTEATKFPSGPDMTADQMAHGVLQATTDWQYDVISIGLPTPIHNGKPLREPINLGPGWVNFDFVLRLGRPVKLINDAAMQALGSYEGGRMLFLGLGTGLGTTLILDGAIAPLELAHLPYKKGKTYEDYVGDRGRKKMGNKKWENTVADVVAQLKAALVADYVVLGGGNSRKLKQAPEGARLGHNENAFIGGFRLWEKE